MAKYREGNTLYINYQFKDLYPLSKAPDPEKPFRDPNFQINQFKSIGDYSKYWRTKGYTINQDGGITEAKKDPEPWAIEVSDTEFHNVRWDLIISAFEEFGGCFGTADIVQS